MNRGEIMKKTYTIKKPTKTEIEVNGDSITITAKGFMNMMNKGLSGSKTIKIKNIVSVQIKKPGLTSGYIQFGMAGDSKSSQGVFAATQDENSVLFLKPDYEDMLELKEYIENYQEPTVVQQSSNTSVADELIKLSDLLTNGIISQDEFDTLKLKLLNK